MEKIISVNNITRTYNGRTVLDNVSFSINRGAFVAIVGHSGGGKSTLLRIIGGEKPCKGTVEVLGKDLSKLGRRELLDFRSKNFGIVYQSDNLIDTLSAKENILLSAYVLKKKRHVDILARYDYLVRLFSLEKIVDKYADTLSGGETQRVALARALLFCPPIILLDEPTESLDDNNKRIILDILTKLNKESGCTIVIITHGKISSDVFDSVLYIEDGKLVCPKRGDESANIY